MTVVAKSGMVINAEKEILGWANKGDDYDMQDGDLLISHFKTAEKHGLLSEFNAMKEDNAPAKAERAPVDDDAEPAKRGPRVPCPREGAYVVNKPDTLTGKEEDNERQAIANALRDNTSFEAFWAAVPEKFNHTKRDGSVQEFATTGFVMYAISRGIISV